jgi:hypothetical protein
MSESSRRWREKYPERARESACKSRLKRRQKDPEGVREYSNNWNASHPEKVRERARVWNKENPEKVREKTRKWRKENPEKVKAQKNKRRSFELGGEGAFTAQEWTALKISTGNMCLCCKRTEQVLVSLGLKLVPDHVVALIHGGSGGITNIQPLCHGVGGCNNKKYTKNTDYRVNKAQDNHGDES